jgi:hypothetical protein
VPLRRRCRVEDQLFQFFDPFERDREAIIEARRFELCL